MDRITINLCVNELDVRLELLRLADEGKHTVYVTDRGVIRPIDVVYKDKIFSIHDSGNFITFTEIELAVSYICSAYDIG